MILKEKEMKHEKEFMPTQAVSTALLQELNRKISKEILVQPL